MMFGTFWQDLKHGARMLRKNPGFTFVAMASIAIGVGANAAMFSLADTLVLRPLTVPRASEIVNVTSVAPKSGFTAPTASALSYPDYEDVRDRARSFSSLAAFRLLVASFADRADQPAQRTFGMAVSGNLFDMLGVQPALGRAIGVDNDRVVGRDPIVVLDHELWVHQFGADHSVIGRGIRVAGIEMTVAGVMPPGFTGPDQFVHPAFYVPLAMVPVMKTVGTTLDLMSREVRNIAVKGRLKPGVSIEQAAEDVALIGTNLQRSYPDTNRNIGLTAQSEFDARVTARPQLAGAAVMLMTLSMAVLLVACANLAGLLTSRSPVRAREMALRLAIGAGRLRITRQLIVESLLLAVGGGAFGLLLASAVITLLQGLQLPTDVPLKLSFDLNDRVLAVGLIVATISAVVSSLLPAWKSTRTDLVSNLKSVGAADPRRTRLWGRNVLVCGQIGLSLVLVTVAVFLFRAYQGEYGRGPGFRTDHVLLMSFEPDLAGYDTPGADRFYDLLVERAGTIPGVRSIALSSSVPFDSISIENTAVVPEGFQFPVGTESVRIRSARVDEGYFDTLGIGIVDGRPFRRTDTSETPAVAVVNQTLASRYWPGRSAVGMRFRVIEGTTTTWTQIVGVAADTRYRTLSEGPTEFIYYSRRQVSAPDSTILVHTASDPARLAGPLRAAIRAIDPSMPVFGVRTMEDFYRASSVTLTNLLIELVGGMGSMGLALSVVGLYGLVAYSVNRRTREIGIRMAVGAQSGAVMRMVMRHGLLLAGAGTLLGLVASIATGGVLRAAFPFPNVPSVDVMTYVLVVPTLFAVTLLAAYIPARRAARIDPLRALRQD
jgi:macrolide transport system ATP-binding/permease protein